MKHRPAEILREYGPFPDADDVAGVTFDGNKIWFASGDRVRSIPIPGISSAPFPFPLMPAPPSTAGICSRSPKR